MQPNFDNEALDKISYLVGNKELLLNCTSVPALTPFDDRILAFLNDVSRILMKDARSKAFSDVITFAFWIRSASVTELKLRHYRDNGDIRMGRGIAFHISPSNVPVNFAYSLAAGLLCGNANIVRVPSKEFPQIDIISDAFSKALESNDAFSPYVLMVRYERDKKINDFLSSICDIRIIWGGDASIAEIRKSPLPPRSTEITFADRYSLTVIDSEYYLKLGDKFSVVKGFYNDTYFTDQNACTSPRIVVWLGEFKEEAKSLFWNELYKLVEEKYVFQDIQGVNKIERAYMMAIDNLHVSLRTIGDNRLVVAGVDELSSSVMDYAGDSGFFIEYDCEDITDLKVICDNKRCQTIGYIGEKDLIIPLVTFGIKGVDRIVPVGRTMDFDLIWDGYDLVSQMSRIIVIMN